MGVEDMYVQLRQARIDEISQNKRLKETRDYEDKLYNDIHRERTNESKPRITTSYPARWLSEPEYLSKISSDRDKHARVFTP